MRAIAKTNLFLKVLGKRADAYHELENLFFPLPEIYDDVEILPGKGKGLYLEAEGNEISCEMRDNLCMKAAEAFCNVTGYSRDFGVFLRKRIPVAAGLGGGSSDAATVLKLLNERSQQKLPLEALQQLAASLGADVPYFLNPVIALGRGRGDRLTTMTLQVSFAILLITPCFPLSVKWAFEHLPTDLSNVPTIEEFLVASTHGTAAQLAATCRNDLEAPIFDKFPLLAAMRDSLLEAGALTAHISGSGPSIFAMTSISSANAVAEAFHKRYDTFSAPVISIHKASPSPMGW